MSFGAGQSVDFWSAPALSGLSITRNPHQLKRLGVLGPKPRYLGDPTLLLTWAGGIPRSKLVCAVLQPLVYQRRRFAEPRDDVTVTVTTALLAGLAGQDFGNVLQGLSIGKARVTVRWKVRAQVRAVSTSGPMWTPGPNPR